MDNGRRLIRQIAGAPSDDTASSPQQGKAKKRVRHAKELLAAGELRAAEGLIREALDLAPDNGATLAAAAAFYLKLSNAYFTQAVELDPAALDDKLRRTRDAAQTGQTHFEREALAHRLADAPAAGAKPALALGSAWPNRKTVWEDTDRVLRRYVLAETPAEPGLLTAGTRVLTMGSCFAENISRHLARYGLPVHYQRMKEEVNTTFANLRLVRWAASETEAFDGELDEVFGPEARLALRDALANCDVYIFSLGVAPTTFTRDGRHRLSLKKGSLAQTRDDQYVRTTGPAENADNVRGIIAALRGINPVVKVFLTLSPVPLAGSSERKSAILADCVSKSSLRLALEAVMADDIPEVRYWPSFEMVKWWGAHLTEMNAFGDDGESRHVSPWMVDKIMDLFVDHYGDEGLQASRRVAAKADTRQGAGL